MKPETNLLERQSQRKDLVPMRICAKPWATNQIMSERNQQLFLGPNQTRFRRIQSLCLILKGKKTQYRNLLLRKVLLLKVCELLENTFPTLGKVTTFTIFNKTRYLNSLIICPMTMDSKNYSSSNRQIDATFFSSPSLGCQNICATFLPFFRAFDLCIRIRSTSI